MPDYGLIPQSTGDIHIEEEVRLHCRIIDLDMSALTSKQYQFMIRAIINDKTPIAIMRQTGFHMLDYLLIGADVLGEEEFDGSRDSNSYAHAFKKLKRKVVGRKGDA